MITGPNLKIGLTSITAVPELELALFTFNVGVEIGQLLFITVILGLLAAVKRVNFRPSVERHALGAANYAVGILASFWFIERLTAFGT